MKTMIVYNKTIPFVAGGCKEDGISGGIRQQEGTQRDKMSKSGHKLPTPVGTIGERQLSEKPERLVVDKRGCLG